LTDIVGAHAVRIWPYQELLKKSDLVVISAAIATSDAKERLDLPGFVGEHVIGVAGDSSRFSTFKSPFTRYDSRHD